MADLIHCERCGANVQGKARFQLQLRGQMFIVCHSCWLWGLDQQEKERQEEEINRRRLEREAEMMARREEEQRKAIRRSILSR